MTEQISLPGGEKFHWVGGQWVESDALRIAERINEYDPNLRVQYLEEAASVGDPPFRVVETGRDGKDYTVFYAWQLDNRLLERVQAHDTMRNDVLGDLEKQNEIAKMNLKRRYRERSAHAEELVKFIVESPKDTLTVTDEVEGRKIQVSSTEPSKEI